MKKTPSRLLTDAFREIRNTLSRFLSLFLLSALAVAFLAGLRTTAPDMEHTADLYYDRTHLMDVRVLSTLGLTDDDIAALARAQGVARAEGAWYVDATVHAAQNDYVVRFHSLSDAGINDPELLEGRLPQGEDECVVEPALLRLTGLAIGDVLAPDTLGTSYEDALSRPRYTIVGTVNSSLYLSSDRGGSTIGTGRLSAVAFLPRSAFRLEYYTEAYLLAEGAAGLVCYSDPYRQKIDALIDSLEPLSQERASARYDQVISQAQTALDDAQREFDDAEARVRQELQDAWQQLSDAREELNDGWQAYYDGQDTLRRETADAQKELSDGEAELRDALTRLEEGEADYAQGMEELNDAQAKYDRGLADYQEGLQLYEEGRAELLEGEETYEENRLTLQSHQDEYDQGLADYEQGLAQLEEGRAKLRKAEQQLKAAAAQLEEGELALNEARAQLEDARAQLEAAQRLYDRTISALEELLHQIDPSLTPDSSDAEIEAAVDAWLDRILNEETADAAAQDLRDLFASLPPEVTDRLPPEVRQRLEALTGADLLAGKAEIKAHMLETVALARQAKAQADAQLADLAGQLAQGEAALEQGEEELRQGKAAYEDGQWQYTLGQRELWQAQEELRDARIRLEDAQAQLTDGWSQLESGRKALDEGWAELSDSALQLDDAQAQLTDARAQLTDGHSRLADARAELDEGWSEYRSGLDRLEEGKARLPRETADAQKKLSDALTKLNDGEAEYAQGLSDYEEGKAQAEQELSDARRRLNTARREISQLGQCKWYLLSRSTNTGYVSYQQDAQRMGNLANVFPLIFFLVAALVCLTTMTRMVEEQRVQIGSLKALGYSRGAIAFKYVGYGFLASFGGGVVGLVVGCTLIPTIIFNAWKVLYTVGDLRITFFPGISLLSVGAAVFCVTGAALAASFAALTAVPASLMRPRAPQAGKRVFLERLGPLWRRLTFTWKVTVRNLFRYQKRFWMTVIGIGGCTALLIAGFGLRDSIHAIFDKQYSQLTTYHAQVSLADDVTDDELTEIRRELERSALVDGWAEVSSSMITAEGPKRSADSYVYLFAVTDQEKFGQFVHLRDRRTLQSVPLTDDGAVITEKLADMLGVGVGDTVTVVDADNSRIQLPITGIAENYVFHYIYLSHAAYTALYGHEPPVNSIMLRYTEDTEQNSDAVASGLIPLSGVSSVSRTDTLRQSVLKGLQGVDYAVVVVVAAAAALAFVVLYNLTNINITERLRELATLKVLGFYERELSAYIYRENIFLTLFGILLGLGMGKFLHQWLVLTVEIDMAMFGRSAKPLSYLLAVALTALFSVLVNLAARLRLRKIDMVESLKTVE